MAHVLWMIKQTKTAYLMIQELWFTKATLIFPMYTILIQGSDSSILSHGLYQANQ